MTPSTVQAIQEHAAREFPKECCGVVIVVNGKERYRPCDNIAATPDEHFVLSPRDYAKASQEGDIIAIVHSHPNASPLPSEADLVQCEAWGLPWHIVSAWVPDGAESAVAGEPHTFQPSGYVAPLVGRSFSHGVLDCYTLIRDYYERELGITLRDFERRDGWWNEPGQNLYLDNFALAGFEPIRGPMQIGDVILMHIRSRVPNHAAVYIGNGQILHHVMRRLSSRDIYDGYWQENTRLVIRYKGFPNE